MSILKPPSFENTFSIVFSLMQYANLHGLFTAGKSGVVVLVRLTKSILRAYKHNTNNFFRVIVHVQKKISREATTFAVKTHT